MIKKSILIPIVALVFCLGVEAQDVVPDLLSAQRLAQDGDTPGAIAALEALTVAEPKNAQARVALGDMLWQAGRDAEALEAYTQARTMGSREGILALARAAALQYRTDEARDLLKAYRATLRKGKRTLAQDDSGDLEDQIDRTEELLGRVQQIEVIDSLVVDADEFFRHYRLSPESGSLNMPSAVLPRGAEYAEGTVVYEPESGREMIWAQADTAGTLRLMGSAELWGGDWERPAPLRGDFNEDDADANYPFMMPDGITLYYAADGDDSLGGLDIYITRRDDDGSYLQSQNLGMPYNSPYDDYMLAIDELTGAGWWATDRNRIPGKVTIYVFVPQELRVNVAPDAPDLRDRALLASIASTRKPGADYASLRRAISSLTPAGNRRDKEQEATFSLAVPGRGVLTSLSQLHSARSRQLMAQLLQGRQRQQADKESLEALRQAWGRGDHSAASQIKELENKEALAARQLLQLQNEIVTLEQD